MTGSGQKPKVILFGISGVCVKTPLHAISQYEEENNIPLGWISYGIDQCKPYGYWQQLERGEHELNNTWFAGWEKDISNPILWNLFWQKRFKTPTPAMPRIDLKKLFWSIISMSRTVDPWMFPALTALKKSELFILVGITNTVKLPSPHDKEQEEKTSELRSMFDIFISSTDVGALKPDPKIYAYALDAADAFAKKNADTLRAKGLGWENGVQPNEILYLDDMADHLKAGSQAGLSVIKVEQDKTWEAVEALEATTGLKLSGDHPKVSPISRRKPNTSKL